MEENDIARIVFDSSLKIHKALDPGLLENSYQECMYLGLLINFNVPLLKDGFRRVVNNL